jgi:hypothetical protein
MQKLDFVRLRGRPVCGYLPVKNSFGVRARAVRDGSKSVYFAVPLPPVISWNHGLSGKIGKDLWGTITCGQNLAFKGLTPGVILAPIPPPP